MAAMLAVLPGCATPGQPVQQPLRLETPGCAQAWCSLHNDRGSWVVARTPGSVTVTTSHEPLRVICHGPDGIQGEAGAASSLPDVRPEGAVLGGAVGTGVGVAAAAPAMAFIPPLGVVIVAFGAAIGATSGHAIESQRRAIVYPELITVPMNCAAAAVMPDNRRAALGFGVRGLAPAQQVATGSGPAAAAVQVTDVAAGGAAERAGLRAGDLVLAARGQPLTDPLALQALALALAVGEQLPLRVWRDGQTLDLQLVQPASPP